MTVIYCDVCGVTLSEPAYILRLWHGENVYRLEDICPACAGKIKDMLNGLKEGKQ